jgi:hypothetical protein
MIYKETKSLFLKKYQYKAVLVCPAASGFRGGDFETALNELKNYEIGNNYSFYGWQSKIKTPDDLKYSISLCSDLKHLNNIETRVESPFISVYTNNVKDINLLEKRYADHVKYISKPAKPGVLEEGVIVMPKMDFDFKVTLSATKTEYSAFIEWAETNSKVKITKSCKRDLAKNRSWGGTHFYVTGANTLLMAKMHLGGSIAKIQRIIKE